MQQLLKRLEIIKTCITLEDEEIIELQVIKLKARENDISISQILSHLELHEFSKALTHIDDYISRHTGLATYEDPLLQSLKLELKVLERQLQSLNEDKNEYDVDIEEFNSEYTLNLGDIIQQVLVLRAQIFQQQLQAKQQAFEQSKADYDETKATLNKLKSALVDKEAEHEAYEDLKVLINEKEEELNTLRKAAKQAKDALTNDPVNKDYQEAKKDSDDFSKEYKLTITESDNYPTLSPEQLSELKLAYRKACRLCHPDIVSDELKERAHALMSELNDAKKHKDLPRVQSILKKLQIGSGFDVASDAIQDTQLLNEKIIAIKQKIKELETEIQKIIKSDDYQTITGIEDKGQYFNDLKQQLIEEVQRLQGVLKGDDENQSELEGYAQMEKEQPAGKDDYWESEF